jgi:hypothetical protein
MFCPKCATQNVEGASFCRACGANISLIPQALSGQLSTPRIEDFPERLRRKRRREPSIEEAIRSIMMGVAFAVISILVGKYSPGGWTWWYWLLIPAAASLGKGFSVLARLKAARNQSQTFSQPQLNTVRPADLPAPKTGELMPPVSSVTEGTTRHLGTDAKTRPFEFSDTQKPS